MRVPNPNLKLGPVLPITRSPTVDNDNDNDSVTTLFEDAFSEPGQDLPTNLVQHNHMGRGEMVNIDGEDVFIPHRPELGGIQIGTPNDEALNRQMAFTREDQILTADSCLQSILAIFPDIKHDHVLQLYNAYGQDGNFELLPGSVRLQTIVEAILSGENYPKQEKCKKEQKKRKRDSSADDKDIKRWEAPNREFGPPTQLPIIQLLLQEAFPTLPMDLIRKTLNTHRHLYQTFLELAKVQDSNRSQSAPSRHLANILTDDNTQAIHRLWPPLVDELQAARKRVQCIRAQQAADEATKKCEQENLQKAIAAGETAECQACYDVLPMNRQLHCNGDVAHFTCLECIETYIKAEVGEQRCRVLCTAGCGAGFARDQLGQLADKALVEKLGQLQQEKDIREAGLENLEECPFCNFKAILPSIEEDFEFRCANPDCEQVSCRRCKSVSHTPLSCEQHNNLNNTNRLNSRHKVEEAMTAALVRSCNKCKKQFIKEHGCNKMTCPSCAHKQCYVCSESLTSYTHFDSHGVALTDPSQPKKCPLFDNVEERHEREVKEAAAAARAEVLKENPDVSEQDLEIKVSEVVQKAAHRRIRNVNDFDDPLAPGYFDPEQFIDHMDDMEYIANVRNRYLLQADRRRAPGLGRAPNDHILQPPQLPPMPPPHHIENEVPADRVAQFNDLAEHLIADEEDVNLFNRGLVAGRRPRMEPWVRDRVRHANNANNAPPRRLPDINQIFNETVPATQDQMTNANLNPWPAGNGGLPILPNPYALQQTLPQYPPWLENGHVPQPNRNQNAGLHMPTFPNIHGSGYHLGPPQRQQNFNHGNIGEQNRTQVPNDQIPPGYRLALAHGVRNLPSQTLYPNVPPFPNPTAGGHMQARQAANNVHAPPQNRTENPVPIERARASPAGLPHAPVAMQPIHPGLQNMHRTIRDVRDRNPVVTPAAEETFQDLERATQEAQEWLLENNRQENAAPADPLQDTLRDLQRTIADTRRWIEGRRRRHNGLANFPAHHFDQ